jgi:PIN domain nuclease of toxin-antitoxin system
VRLVLDTHALVWWATNSKSLSKKAKSAIGNEANDVFVSAASAWEITTKVRIGKIEWPPGPGTVKAYVLDQGFLPLPISFEHAERAGQLAMAHRDPFDRMLIAQAQAEDLWLVSNETVFDETGVRRYW